MSDLEVSLRSDGWVVCPRLKIPDMTNASLATTNEIAVRHAPSQREGDGVGGPIAVRVARHPSSRRLTTDSDTVFDVGLSILSALGHSSWGGPVSREVTYLRLRSRTFPSTAMTYSLGGEHKGYLITVPLKYRMSVLVYEKSHVREASALDGLGVELLHDAPEPRRVDLGKGDILIQDKRLVFSRGGTMSLNDSNMCNAIMLSMGPIDEREIQPQQEEQSTRAHRVIILRDLPI